MNTLLKTLDQLVMGNSISQWAQALAIALVVFLIMIVVRRVGRRNYQRMAMTATVEFMEVPLHLLSRTATTFILIVSAFIGFTTLHTSAAAHSVAEKLLVVIACWQVGIWASTGAIAWIELKQRDTFEHDRAVAGTLGIVSIIVRGIIWSLVLLLTLDNLNIKISTLVAGLGIGGVAVALAVQNVLGDLLASLAITIDKPFVVGDSLGVDNFNGTVESIGLKTTRLRSPTGEQIVMPNANLLASRLRNFSRQAERLIVLKMSVAGDTPHTTLERVPQLVRDALHQLSEIRFERCHLTGFNAAAAEFELAYTVLKPDYVSYLDAQQSINLRLHELYEQENIKFA